MSAVSTYTNLTVLQSNCSKGIFLKIRPPCHTAPWLSEDLVISTLPCQHILYQKYAIATIINLSFSFVNHFFDGISVYFYIICIFLQRNVIFTRYKNIITLHAKRAITTACRFHVRLKYPTNSRIRAFKVKYHFVLAPKPTHFIPCFLAKIRARNTW